MSDKPMSVKQSRMLRYKAQEFLATRRNPGQLMELMRHFETGADTCACLHALETVFCVLLSESQMYQEIVPLKVPARTVDVQYVEWLRSVYEQFWQRVLAHFDSATPRVQMQALSTAMLLLEHEGRHPLEQRTEQRNYMPVYRLKSVLTAIFNMAKPMAQFLAKFQEHLQMDDLRFYVWKSLPSITVKIEPTKQYIMNYLLVLDRLPLCSNAAARTLFCCCDNFVYDEVAAAKCLNKIWNCVMQWDHDEATHKQLLIVLLERVLPHLEKPLIMTDFLMDSLDHGGAIGLLALQGIFTMIQIHNLDYPNIFAKLYSMFEPELFHTKFKSRLFYLADMFLSSTHLPENMVAAFVKRLARLSLVAPSEDVVIICLFIGNLILRHPGLKCMLNHPEAEIASDDPYIMEECDPVKSNAINSSLWEIRTLQNHSLPNVAVAARIINSPLPSVEWDITKYLDNTSDDIFDAEIRKNHNLIAMAFDRPQGFRVNLHDVTSEYWAF